MTDQNSTLPRVEPFVRHTAFTLWRNEPHPTRPGDKPIKVPVHYDGRTRHDLGDETKGRPANPAPPLTADLALQWLAHNRAAGVGHDRPNDIGYLGTGFRPDGTGLVCIDADNCVTPTGWTPEALRLMARFPGALIEQSVSGTGAHIWVTVQGAGPGRCGQKTTPMGKIEVYGGGQFIACGTVLGGDASVDHTAAVAALVAEFWPARDVVGPVAGAEFDAMTSEQQTAVLADVASALSVLDPDNRDEWVANGQALQSLSEAGYRLWAAWSARSTRFPGGDGLEKWDSFSGERTDYRAVLARAQRSGWVNPASRPGLPSDASAVFASAVPAALPPGALLEPPASRQVASAPAGELSFMAAGGGLMPATLATVATVLMSPESGVQLRYDVFKDDQYISIAGEPWRPIANEDEIDLRIRFERRGFKPVAAECMSDAIKAACRANRVDSAMEWVKGLQWDGVPRIEGMLSTYYQAEDTSYTRAVGAYMMTAMAGRSLQPGVKADMMPIFIGMQGGGKTSSVEVLSPDPANFGELDMSKKDADLARSLRGKQVMELAELQGLSGRALESTKAWVSRKDEKWIPKFEERETVYKRRILVIGTTNEKEILDDPTGERRFLPVPVGAVDLLGLVAVREQLWAEGAARFLASGVAWQEAMRLAPEVHAQHKVHDEWLEMVVRWLDMPPLPTAAHPEFFDAKRNGDVPLVLGDVLTAAVRIPAHQIDAKATKRMSKIMRGLNYETKPVWIGGHAVRRWVRR